PLPADGGRRALGRRRPRRLPTIERAAGGISGGPRSQAPRAGLEPATNRLHRVPPFPTGVDYLITVGRAACRWRALGGSLSFRHSLVSAPSLRPSSRRAWLRVTVCDCRVHLGFPEFTRFSLTGFPVRLR